MTNAEKFLEQADCFAHNEFYIRKEYQGRNFYKGPAINCESQHEVDEIRKAMQMECIQDSMGKGFILYPKNPNFVFCGDEQLEESEDSQNLDDMDTTELIEIWSSRNRFTCLEGDKGVRQLLNLINACTDKDSKGRNLYSSINEALADNPYLIEAMIQAMSEREEYKDNLVKELSE